VTLLQAAANPAGPAGGCLRLVTEGRVILHLSEAGLAELVDVLGRAKVRKRFPQITDEAVDTFLAGLRSLARVAGEVPPTFRYGRDPDDEHILLIGAQLWLSSSV
jgi:predicted nucleic acid-binding protein